MEVTAANPIEPRDASTVQRFGATRSYVTRQRALGESGDAKFAEWFRQYRLGIDVESAAAGSVHLSEAFPSAGGVERRRLVIEVGFGLGDALVELAAARPSEDLVGFEVHRPGVFRAMRGLVEREISHVRVVMCDVLDALPALADGSVDEYRVYFPDPWIKRRHWHRRLLRASVLEEFARTLAPEGVVFVATDIEEYASFVVEQCAAVVTLRADVTSRPHWRPVTSFEAKGLRMGRTPIDIRLTKREPEHR